MNVPELQTWKRLHDGVKKHHRSQYVRLIMILRPDMPLIVWTLAFSLVCGAPQAMVVHYMAAIPIAAEAKSIVLVWRALYCLGAMHATKFFADTLSKVPQYM